MEVLITAQGAKQAGELESLRAWLDAPGNGVPWVLAPVPADDSTLGLGVEEICAVITAADALVHLAEWVANWRESHQEPPPVTLTITIGPATAAPAAVSDDGANPEGGADSRHDDEPDT